MEVVGVDALEAESTFRITYFFLVHSHNDKKKKGEEREVDLDEN